MPLVTKDHYLYLLILRRVMWGVWSRSQLILGERRGTHRTDRQSITGLAKRQTTIHAHIHTYGQFGNGAPRWLRETEENPDKNPRRHRENMQAPHRKAPGGRQVQNPKPSCSPLKVQPAILIQYTFCQIQRISPHDPPAVCSVSVLYLQTQSCVRTQPWVCKYIVNTVRKERWPRNKCYDQARAKSRVNIGEDYQQWRNLRELKGTKTDAEVALFLLDRWVTLVLLCL